MAEQTLQGLVSEGLEFKEARINKELFESAGGSDNEPMKITFGSDHIIVNVKGDTSVKRGQLDIDEYTGKYLGISEPTEVKVEPMKFREAKSVTFINSVKIEDGEGDEKRLSEGLQTKFLGKYLTERDKITVRTDGGGNKIPLEIKEYDPKEAECIRVTNNTTISVDLISSNNIGEVLPESEDVETTYADIQAHEDKREEIEDIVNSALSGSKIFNQSGTTGLLLYGPKGSGKSKLAKAVANESNAAIRILSKNVLTGPPEKVDESVEKAFDAVKKQDKSILLIESIPHISSNKSAREEFISQVESLTEDDNLFIFAECRDIDDVNPEFLRKCGLNNKLRIGFPSRESRERILSAEMRERTHFLTQDDFFELSKFTAGFSISDILSLIQTSKYSMYRRIRQTYPLYKSVSDVLEDEDEGLKMQDFVDGLENVRPTLSKDRSINEVYVPKKGSRGAFVSQKDIATLREYLLENSESDSNMLTNRTTYLLYGPNKDDSFEIILSVSADLGWPVVTINTKDMVKSNGFGRILQQVRDISPAIMLIDDVEYLFAKVGENRIKEALNKGVDNSGLHLMGTYYKPKDRHNDVLASTTYESIGNKMYIGFPDKNEVERILDWSLEQKGWNDIDSSSLLDDMHGLSGKEIIATVNKADVYARASNRSICVKLIRDTVESLKLQNETKLRETVNDKKFYDENVVDTTKTEEENQSSISTESDGDEIEDGFVWEK